MNTGVRRRSTPAGARRGKPAAAPGAVRWGVQLVVSGMLFLLVFIGRGVFPGQAEAVRQLLQADWNPESWMQQAAAWAGEKVPGVAWLEELARYTPACIFSRKAGMPEDASEDLRRRIWSDRLKADGQLFLIDLESDLAVISSHMPMQVSTRVRPIISPDMPMYH